MVEELTRDTGDDVDHLKEQLRQKEGRLETAQAQARVLEERLREAGRDRDNFQDQNCFLKQDLELCRQKLDSVESRQGKKVQELEGRIEELDRDLKDALEYKRVTQERIVTTEDELAELGAKLFKANGAVARYETDLGLARGQRDTAGTEMEQLRRHLDEVTKGKRELEEELRSVRSERERLSRETGQASKKQQLERAGQTEQVIRLQTAVAAQQQQLEALERERAELYGRLREKSEAFEKQRSDGAAQAADAEESSHTKGEGQRVCVCGGGGGGGASAGRRRGPFEAERRGAHQVLVHHQLLQH